jgi:hypothetical protein
MPRVVQHLLERVQVVVELHPASVTDPTDIHERFRPRRAAEKLGSPLRWWGVGRRGADALADRRRMPRDWLDLSHDAAGMPRPFAFPLFWIKDRI